jgi:hypothetical protein
MLGPSASDPGHGGLAGQDRTTDPNGRKNGQNPRSVEGARYGAHPLVPEVQGHDVATAEGDDVHLVRVELVGLVAPGARFVNGKLQEESLEKEAA